MPVLTHCFGNRHRTRNNGATAMKDKFWFSVIREHELSKLGLPASTKESCLTEHINFMLDLLALCVDS